MWVRFALLTIYEHKICQILSSEARLYLPYTTVQFGLQNEWGMSGRKGGKLAVINTVATADRQTTGGRAEGYRSSERTFRQYHRVEGVW